MHFLLAVSSNLLKGWRFPTLPTMLGDTVLVSALHKESDAAALYSLSLPSFLTSSLHSNWSSFTLASLFALSWTALHSGIPPIETMVVLRHFLVKTEGHWTVVTEKRSCGSLVLRRKNKGTLCVFTYVLGDCWSVSLPVTSERDMAQLLIEIRENIVDCSGWILPLTPHRSRV